MGNRMECPGCKSTTSSVWHAVKEGEPCPYCGLSAAAIEEIEQIRESKGNDELKEQVERLLLENHKLWNRVHAAESQLDEIKRLLCQEGPSSQDTDPDAELRGLSTRYCANIYVCASIGEGCMCDIEKRRAVRDAESDNMSRFTTEPVAPDAIKPGDYLTQQGWALAYKVHSVTDRTIRFENGPRPGVNTFTAHDYWHRRI